MSFAVYTHSHVTYFSQFCKLNLLVLPYMANCYKSFNVSQ